MMTIRAKQRGLSLISLMIALTIGAFLLAGLFTLWLQTRNTFNAQGSLAQLQDNERMALTVMANTVQNSGYYPIFENYGTTPPSPLFTAANVFPAASASTYTFGASGQYITGTYGGGTASDSITVRYMSDSNALDCLGQAQGNQILVTNTYTVSGGNLTCAVTATTIGGAVTKTGAMTVVSGVSQFIAYYGVDPNNTGSVTEYLTADDVTSSNYWPDVRSVKLQLTFANPLYGQTGQTKAQMPMIERIVAVAQTTTSL
jgi:type IV pilus assembly protein PilW